MANGVWHAGHHIVVHLTHADLGHPDRPELLTEITQPVNERDRELLECLEHHDRGFCRAEDENRSPWMAIRRRTVGGVTKLVAAHLPIRTKATAQESTKHLAMKERIARTASEHGLQVDQEVRSADGRIRTDVLVTGPAGRVGWEPQYSPHTDATVRRRSTRAVERNVTPLWVTPNEDAALIDRAPWVLVHDQPWQVLQSRKSLRISGGTRYLQDWKCDADSDRPCPGKGGQRSCGQYHAHWSIPVLCMPPRPSIELDELVVTSATGDWVPMRIPDTKNRRVTSRLWTPREDRARWRELVGEPPPEETPTHMQEGELTFTEAELDARCRYGENTHVFNDTRTRRFKVSAVAPHTWSEPSPRLSRVPRQRGPSLSAPERRQVARQLGCLPWHVGPCAGCASPINRYGPNGARACTTCRTAFATR